MPVQQHANGSPHTQQNDRQLTSSFPLARNLAALSRQLARERAAEDGSTVTSRHCLIFCVLLLSQLLLNYIFT